MEKGKSCLFTDVVFTVLVILCGIEVINSNKQLTNSLDKNTKAFNELILKIKYTTGE